MYSVYFNPTNSELKIDSKLIESVKIIKAISHNAAHNYFSGLSLQIKDESGLVMLNKMMSSYVAEEGNSSILNIDECVASFGLLTISIHSSEEKANFNIELVLEDNEEHPS